MAYTVTNQSSGGAVAFSTAEDARDYVAQRLREAIAFSDSCRDDPRRTVGRAYGHIADLTRDALDDVLDAGLQVTAWTFPGIPWVIRPPRRARIGTAALVGQAGGPTLPRGHVMAKDEEGFCTNCFEYYVECECAWAQDDSTDPDGGA